MAHVQITWGKASNIKFAHLENLKIQAHLESRKKSAPIKNKCLISFKMRSPLGIEVFNIQIDLEVF